MSEPMDVYCDSTQISTSPFDLSLYLYQRVGVPNSSQPAKQVGCIRMSLEHAKVLTIMLKKSIKQYEDSQGTPIILHPGALQGAGISKEEDW